MRGISIPGAHGVSLQAEASSSLHLGLLRIIPKSGELVV
jgi:hypothetical protein